MYATVVFLVENSIYTLLSIATREVVDPQVLG